MSDYDDPLDSDTFSGPGSALLESFMNDEIVTAPPTTTLRAAARLLDEAGVGVLVVGTSDSVEGVVSERDILRAVAHEADLDGTLVTEIESRELRWATPTNTVDDVIEEMMEGYIRHVLVADERGTLVAIASMRDLITAFLD